MFLTVTPDGTALPCQAARMLPDLEFPNVTEHDVAWIWERSPAFNRYRGFEWMKEPCRTCPEREKDFGGCRCQAYLIAGDAASADPVCRLSPHRGLVDAQVEDANTDTTPGGELPDLVFRNPRNSKALSA